MLLQKLSELAGRSDNVLPPMYKKGFVPWIIDIDLDGILVGNGFVATSSGEKKDKGKEFVIPNCGPRPNQIKPNLLVDKAEYVLGMNRDVIDRKTILRHSAFVELVKCCAEKTANQKVWAIDKFLNDLNFDELELPKELKHDQIVSFRIDGEFPTDQPDIQRYWQIEHGIDDRGGVSTDEYKDHTLTECHICGKLCNPINPHPVQIKGLGMIGGQTSGMAMISANEVAFESYGLEHSLIAPTCQSCAEAYANAANELIKSKDSRITVKPLIYIFWTKNQIEVPSLSLINTPTPDPEQVKKLILSAQRGVNYDAMDDEAFYATAWSASGARIAVRDWIVTTVGDVRRNVSRWFELQQLAAEYADDTQFYGIWSISASLYHDPNKQMVANVPEVLLYVALQGGKLPPWLLYQAVKRNRTEQAVTRPRLALIKMVLLTKGDLKGSDDLVELNKENTEPAYLCGRLLAELESIQKASINANATIVDRYYGSASSAPASVFGTLLRGTQSHLAKLRKEKPGLFVTFQKRLEEIQSGLMGFPRILTLEEQGLFALGYYHQRVNDRMKKDTGNAGSSADNPVENNQKESDVK